MPASMRVSVMERRPVRNGREPGRSNELCFYPRHNRRVPHISLVFREMWDTTALHLKPFTGRQTFWGAPCSHQRTWAENDGRSPPQLFFPDVTWECFSLKVETEE